MRPASYKVVLTKGAHTVRADDANAILDAIESGKKVVQVGLELFPGAEEVQPTMLVTAHIIALAPVERPQRELVADAGPKVSALWERRAR